MRWRAAWLAALIAAGTAQAGVLRYCDPAAPLSAAQKDRLLRFGAAIESELEASGRGVAIVARSGLDLSRFAMRYSHAGFSLRADPDTRWAVRQLYYACDEHRPRIYDQGMAAFVFGAGAADVGYVSVLLLPPAASEELARAALDPRLALQVLADTYSANAYAFGLRYQNCNQWVLEVLAAARRHLDAGAEVRAQAQRWLQREGYVATVFDVASPLLMALAHAIPWLHDDDHPSEDLGRLRYRVTMPASIEAFVHEEVPGAARIEFCHDDRRIVVHRGWTPIAEGCAPGTGDSMLSLVD